MLMRFVFGFAGLFLLFVAVVATRPSSYHVERNLEIAAPVDLVFDLINDLHRFAGVIVLFGSPFETADPAMQKTIAGPPAGVGQSYAWSGNKDVGKGTMTIEESLTGRNVRMKFEFVEPMKSAATWGLDLAPTPTGTLVTWSMDGNHNFLGKAFGLIMNIDDMLGSDIEKGLARLRTVAEGTPAAASADSSSRG